MLQPDLPATQPKKTNVTVIVLVAVAGLVALYLGGVITMVVLRSGILDRVAAEISPATGAVKVDDCVNDVHFEPTMTVVDCSSPDARYQVLGLDKGKTWADTDLACRDFVGFSYVYFMADDFPITESTTGTYLCLKRFAPN